MTHPADKCQHKILKMCCIDEATELQKCFDKSDVAT